MLSKNEYNVEKLSDLINIIKELSAHSSLNSSIYMDNNYIPLKQNEIYERYFKIEDVIYHHIFV